jgi:CheY-like chemotaxis protein
MGRTAPTILVVDDNRRLLAAVAGLLEGEGYRVRQAGDGAAALEQALREPPDLVLSDVAMPRLDGLALARALRARRPGLPIVLMSAAAGEVASVPGVPLYPKPVEPADLLGIVARLLAAPAGRAPGAAAARQPPDRREGGARRGDRSGR